jgi:hypothetical protein
MLKTEENMWYNWIYFFFYHASKLVFWGIGQGFITISGLHISRNLLGLILEKIEVKPT